MFPSLQIIIYIFFQNGFGDSGFGGSNQAQDSYGAPQVLHILAPRILCVTWGGGDFPSTSPPSPAKISAVVSHRELKF